MSLLMDALKRAELAKQQGRGESASSLSLEPVAAAEPGAELDSAPATLPELPSKLEDLDEEFIAQAKRPGPRRSQSTAENTARTPVSARPASSSPALEQDREAIRNAFAAKTSMSGDRRIYLLGAALGLLALGGIGIWLWLELKPTPGIAAPKPASGAELAAARPIAATNAPTAASASPATGPVASSQADPTTQPRPTATSRQPNLRPTNSESDNQAAATHKAASARAMRQPTPPSQPAGDAAIRVTTSRAGIAPGVADGYKQLQAGNIAAAKSAYAEVLRGDPRNSDALHGIAAIALREGRKSDAQAAYQRILEINPADPAALAGLSGLSGQADPVAGESQMKSLLAAQGEQPVVSFALGNLYARQQRWSEAQQAYFKAVAGDASNPDYLFNLAVSLDQLHQPKLAAQYYGQALSAAEQRPAAFDRTQAARRLRELQP